MSASGESDNYEHQLDTVHAMKSSQTHVLVRWREKDAKSTHLTT